MHYSRRELDPAQEIGWLSRDLSQETKQRGDRE